MARRDRTRQEPKKTLTIIVITGNKGGTGKTTIAALLAEYLNYQNKKVNLVDTDPSLAFQTWINNCSQENRLVSSPLPSDYQIIDTAGISGAGLAYLKKADLILVPFVPHYVDLQVIIPWFSLLAPERQEKVFFIPNRYQKTKEQREGIQQIINETRQDKKVKIGTVLFPLSNRPAIYGPVLSGSPTNFFTNQKKSASVAEVFQQLFQLFENYAKNN